ncbi:DUF802 domain-containing protein [Ralstonia insidiosa]|uniref:DUF802 domain-containing protein n=1 Tax=Ralstonia insidiosa TaxID=190721 RepID=A0A848P4W3_9RALS|nr:DUF802 domain-containing protein [Ralstonia insidiosa]NMV40557.1 DUF802 domain-containing protein [Ralstonia insidiosa]
MSRNHLNLIVFFVGLVALGWIAAGYVVGLNPLALVVTIVIGAAYVAGALELRRYQQATGTLTQAVAGLSEQPPKLGAWLEQLHPSLRNAVRLRVEGERVALPGPALTPYLVGLLVLLGMLGTLLGMVMTLKGTGAALESATDLQAIRASLAAPVKGLGFSFGTSIAGVATSAMLGLLSALCRRERLQAVQVLDTQIATTLRIYSHAHQREETFKLLQRQSDAMPALVDRLQAMMAALEQQSAASSERQIASQQAFLDKTEVAYRQLASSVGQSLQDSAAESARVAGAALQPVVDSTMAGLARESAALHETVTHAVQRQLDGLSTRFETTAETVASIWNTALSEHQRASAALVGNVGTSLDRFADTFEQRSTRLLDGVAERLDATAGSLSGAWSDALSRQEHTHAALAGQNQRALEAAVATFAQHAVSLQDTSRQSHTALQTALESRDQQRLAAWTDALGAMGAKLSQAWEKAGADTANRQQEICDALAATARDIVAQQDASRQSHVALQTALEARDQQRLTAWTDALGAMGAKLSQAWEKAGADTASRQQEICDALAQTARDVASAQDASRQSLVELQTALQARDQQRLSAWTDALGAMGAKLSQEWEKAGADTASRQQEICDALAQTARDISSQTQAHANNTIAEISRLVQAASEAPKAAAEVVAELRQKLSDSMVRDTAMLEERTRMLGTLETLLDAVNHASTEQRTAVDALVASSAELLERVGVRFTDRVEAETGKLDAVAAQVTGSAVEVASLGEAFGAAVHVFGESNDKLVAHLQRIEAALDKSLTRSDEQLAYYVAQAREVIDLSMLSQKQILEDLQRVGGHSGDQRALAGTEAA